MPTEFSESSMNTTNNYPKISASVIVCTYNRCDSLAKTIECLAMQQVPESIRWEIIIVDNNSSDKTKEAVTAAKSNIANLKYEFEKQQGLSHARNHGIDCATGDILLFTDDDVCPEPDWIYTILKGFEEYNCDACGGYITPNWETPPPHWLTERFYGFLAVKTDNRPPYQIQKETDYPFGANMAIKRSVIEHVGNFDTNRGRKGNVLAGGEDDEMFRKIITAGYRAMYFNMARVCHRVESFRVEKNYFRRWRYQSSRNIALTSNLKSERQLLGVPLYIFMQFFRSVYSAVVAKITLPSDEAFQKEMIIFHFLGTMSGLIHKHSQNAHKN